MMFSCFPVEMESVVGEVSAQLLELARKQRMNTDVRKNIFCVIMSSQVDIKFSYVVIKYHVYSQVYIMFSYVFIKYHV